MEIFNNELAPILAFAFAVPLLILVIGIAFKKRSERRDNQRNRNSMGSYNEGGAEL